MEAARIYKSASEITSAVKSEAVCQRRTIRRIVLLGEHYRVLTGRGKWDFQVRIKAEAAHGIHGACARTAIIWGNTADSTASIEAHQVPRTIEDGKHRSEAAGGNNIRQRIHSSAI